MAVAEYRGVVKGRNVVLEKGAELPDGTGVIVTPVRPVKGSPKAVLAALKRSHHMSHEVGEELRRHIKEAKQPLRFEKGGSVLLEEAPQPPDGAGVIASPMEPPPGSAQAIRAALAESPPVSHEDVQELLRLIEESKRPVRHDNPLTRGRRKRG